MGIRELKDHLSSYIKELKSGVAIFVLDRNQVVGELRQPSQGTIPPMLSSSLNDLISREMISLPSRPKSACPPSPLCTKDGTSERLLSEMRGE